MEVAKELGAELGFDVKIEDAKIKIKVSYDGKGADAAVEVALEAEYFLDKLAEAIPGQVDDMVIAALKGALK